MATDDGALVLDFGTSSVKAGWSGEDTPRSQFPTVVTRLKPKDAREAREIRRAESIEHSVESVSVSSLAASPDVPLTHPVERGRVIDFDAMEKLLMHTFSIELDTYPESLSVPVLIAETPGMDKGTRERMTQILFETFKVSGVSFASTAVLSLFASGRTRGLVLECGSGVSNVVPVFEGYSLPHAALKLEAAGQDVTEYLQRSLRAQDLPYQAVCDMKHEIANCSPVSGKGSNSAKVEYELPDGTTVNVDGVYTSACVDLLFNPDDYGMDNLDGGLGDMVAKAIDMCDKDLQPDLCRNIVLSGGSTMIRGFSERVRNDVSNKVGGLPLQVVPDSAGIEPGYNSQRKIGAWIGGSILASLDTFGKICVSKQDYEDSGTAAIVHRKAVV